MRSKIIRQLILGKLLICLILVGTGSYFGYLQSKDYRVIPPLVYYIGAVILGITTIFEKQLIGKMNEDKSKRFIIAYLAVLLIVALGLGLLGFFNFSIA